jgi:hypothetical protein
LGADSREVCVFSAVFAGAPFSTVSVRPLDESELSCATTEDLYYELHSLKLLPEFIGLPGLDEIADLYLQGGCYLKQKSGGEKQKTLQSSISSGPVLDEACTAYVFSIAQQGSNTPEKKGGSSCGMRLSGPVPLALKR